METCNHKMSNGESCGRTLHDDEHCIFHSTDIERKKKEFKDEFWQEFERQKKSEKPYDFKGFVFPDDISFEKVEFEKDASFVHATFSGKADFRSATFSGEAYFMHATFSGRASFGSATFSGEADFRSATFSGEASFELATFSGKVLAGLFEALKNKGITRIRKGRYKIKDFRFRLSENIARVYPVIDRMTRDALYLDDYKSNYPIIYWFWNITADCGRSFLRWAAWSIGIALLFALFFCPPPAFFGDWWIGLCDKIGPCFQQTADAYKGEPLGFWSSIYFSIVTFTTLGFGDVVTANTMARFLVTLEVILGYVMLGGLISILANKLARRS